MSLALNIFLVVEQGGAQSWLGIGFIYVQTSEFVKLLLVLFLAAFFLKIIVCLMQVLKYLLVYNYQDRVNVVLLLLGIALILLIFQKDLGTALVYFCTFLIIIYVATARIFYVIFGGAIFLISSFVCYCVFGHVQARVDSWINPWLHFKTKGYQIIQSFFAIASGGFWGVGLGQGSPWLIPAVHTDFIFAAICEEMGLAGGILFLFILFICRGIKIALSMSDEFLILLTAGLTALIALQVFIIIAGVIKLLPLTGIVLPYVSYGGSALLANFILLGLLLNISHLSSR
ncbi:MAG: FtsW/RodA/SpoVE family cell cycle protein [Desulfotomaculum sp.]|nr:FtsW/RodA/SpoVE family cell cycle protein [Desulfotomaculum sp.]